MDHFPCDITRMWKFDYYSVDHTWGGSTRFKCLTFYGENPTSTCIPACKLRLEIATHERTALFVEQRECFHLPFVTTSCDLPSWRYSRLEITLSFHNAQSVPLLVSRLLYKDSGQSWLDNGAQSDEPQPWWQHLSVCEASLVGQCLLCLLMEGYSHLESSQTLKRYQHSRGSLLWAPLSSHDHQKSLMQSLFTRIGTGCASWKERVISNRLYPWGKVVTNGRWKRSLCSTDRAVLSCVAISKQSLHAGMHALDGFSFSP